MAQPKVRKFAGDLRFWEHGANGARIPVIPEPADKFGNQPLEQSSLTFSYEAGDSVEIKSKRRDARYQQIIHKDSNPGVTSVSITALEVPTAILARMLYGTLVATQVAAGTANLGDRAEQTGGQFEKAGKAAQSMAFSIGEISEAAKHAMTNLGNTNPLQNFANALNKLTAQRKQLAGLKKELEEAGTAQDKFLESAKEGLQRQFDFVGESELNEVAQLQAGIARQRAEADAAAQKAAQDRLKAIQAEAEAQAQADRARIGGGSGKEDVLVIDWRTPSKEVMAAATAEERQFAERIVGLVAPAVLRKVQQSRAVSVRGRQG